MGSPSDKGRPGGKHPSEPSETVFLPHSRTSRTDISLFSNLPPVTMMHRVRVGLAIRADADRCVKEAKLLMKEAFGSNEPVCAH